MNNSKKTSMLITGGAVVLAVVSFLAYYIASPYVALLGMKRAMDARDGVAFASYIDVPKLRENLKSELLAAARQNTTSSMADNPFKEFAVRMAEGVVSKLVDAIVSEEGLKKMMSGEFQALLAKDPDLGGLTQSPSNKPPKASEQKMTTSYDSLDKMSVRVDDSGSTNMTLLFERQGLFTWKLVGIKADFAGTGAPVK